MTTVFRNGLLIALAVIVLDQITKLWAASVLSYASPVAMVPGFNFTLLYNKGAAFSFLGDADGWQRWFFLALALGVSTWLALWLRKLGEGERWMGLSLALLIGGALGNAIDRVYLGYVIDFIDLYCCGYHWPAFNVADSAISVGAVLLFVLMWNQDKDVRKQEAEK
ncbi:MAG: signal peptidase II [Halothiobacillaceae bacterium]|nr:signal peptidase II [Halothiobacillaceae bacterium]